LANVANPPSGTPIHDSHCWDRATLERVTLHRKKIGQTFAKHRERAMVRAILLKLSSKKPHIRTTPVRRTDRNSATSDTEALSGPGNRCKLADDLLRPASTIFRAVAVRQNDFRLVAAEEDSASSTLRRIGIGIIV